MKANDFRIGNIVQYKLDGFFITHRIGWEDLKELLENPEAFNKMHKPLKIKKRLKIKYSNLLEYHDVKYIHELQNLFFALRGMELEIIL
jgi:hypothetical protein